MLNHVTQGWGYRDNQSGDLFRRTANDHPNPSPTRPATISEETTGGGLRFRLGALSVLSLLILVVIIGAALGSGGATTAQQATDTFAVAQPSPETATPVTPSDRLQRTLAELNQTVREKNQAAGGFGGGSDGSYVVGSGIATSTYQANPSRGDYCYWARVRGTSSESDIIANHYEEDFTTVTIRPTDGLFVTNSCGTWSKVDFDARQPPGESVRRYTQCGPDQRLCHVEHPSVVNAPSLALIVTTAGPLPMLLAMIDPKSPVVSLSLDQ